MRFLLLLVFVKVSSVFGQLVHPANNVAFLQNEVASVYITIETADLNLILTDSSHANTEFPATFRYQSSSLSDTVLTIGFRLRGNTSRDAAKKSFKVSFNEFVPGRKWLGLEKLNLNGEHNDVSIMRQRISMQLLKNAAIPVARTSYVKLYINNEYKGLYLNVEHIDEEFLQKRFLNDDHGNLFKCAYGANLKIIGTNQAAYETTYELKTNKSINDYSGLINFINTLNNSSDNDFTCEIQNVFDVELFLRTYAAEILVGQWDGYAVNMNNYYLYQRPSDGKFTFLQYDLDNTFGIDWGVIQQEDWSNRNIYTWFNGDKPLCKRLLENPYFKDRFTFHMKDLLTNFFIPQNLVDELEQTQSLIMQAALTDDYKGYDYGFSDYDFQNAITIAFGNHVAFSLKDYIDYRAYSALNQLVPLENLQNPCISDLTEYEESIFSPIKSFDVLGREINLDSKNTFKILIDNYGRTKRIFTNE
jgi:spore coat protein CotH